jgi:hypothetical protein
MDVNKSAIAKLIGKELASSSALIDANRGVEHKIEFLIKGEVVVKKGENFNQVVSFAVPYDKIVAVLLSKLNGVTLESVVAEAMSDDIDTSDVKKRATEALSKIKGIASKSMEGKVTFPSCVVTIADITECVYC